MGEQKVPEGAAVERLSVIMAAAAGYAWHKLGEEQARAIRVMANAALLDPLVAEHAAAIARIRARLEDAIDSARKAGAAMDGPDADEQLIQCLYRGAMAVSTLLAILDGQEIAEDDGKEEF